MTPVEWLEGAAFHRLTKIALQTKPNEDGLVTLRSTGSFRARTGPITVRPMFETFRDGYTSSMQVTYLNPCPTCDDFAYTRPCAEHPDRGTEGIHAPGTAPDTREVGQDEPDRRGLSHVLRVVDAGDGSPGIAYTPAWFFHSL